MNNLAAVIVPPVVPYYGYYGGIDINLLPTWGIAIWMFVVTLLLVALSIAGYQANKLEFCDTTCGADKGFRIIAIIIDIIAFGAYILCGWFYYICIDELISRF
jgi:hypothetical protein